MPEGPGHSSSSASQDYYEQHGDEEAWANVDYFDKKGQNNNNNASESRTRDEATSCSFEVKKGRGGKGHNSSPPHQMMAILEEGSLRVAFRLQEDDV